jgi:hypothetical protein
MDAESFKTPIFFWNFEKKIFFRGPKFFGNFRFLTMSYGETTQKMRHKSFHHENFFEKFFRQLSQVAAGPRSVEPDLKKNFF